MSFPRYPKYKESGVEWLGEVPEHWSILPNKALLSHFQKLVGESWRERQLLSLTLQGVIDRDIDSGHGKYPSDFGTYQDVAKGDVIFCLFDIDETPRTVGLSLSSGMITAAYDVFRCKSNADPAFVTYYYLHIDSHKGLRPFYTGLRKVVRPPTFMAIKVSLPPLPEQTRIAVFLDRETAKIDALVAEQQRLIELLKEKRQAVISHAVTKGLNPKAPMKPSGIEWLGDVPRHWAVKRLKHVKANEKNAFVDGPFGSNLKSEHFIENGDVYVIESGFATQGKLDTDDLKTISFEHFETVGRSETRSGDIIIAKIGAQFGKSSILPALDKRAVVSGNSLKLTIDQSSCDVRFVHWHLTNLKAIGTIDDIVNGTAQPALSLGNMNNLPMLVPPRAEQLEIVLFLKRSTERFDALTAEAQRAIDLLQERRTALISAAVTGQIDVRQLAVAGAA